MSENEHVMVIKRELGYLTETLPRHKGLFTSIERHTDEMARQLAEAEQKVELYEWAAYQRRRIPSITDDEIMRLTYVPEWRDHDDK